MAIPISDEEADALAYVVGSGGDRPIDQLVGRMLELAYLHYRGDKPADSPGLLPPAVIRDFVGAKKEADEFLTLLEAGDLAQWQVFPNPGKLALLLIVALSNKDAATKAVTFLEKTVAHKLDEGRRKGGRNKAANRKGSLEERNKAIVNAARDLLKEGRRPRDLKVLVKKRLKLEITPRQIGNILRDHGLA